MSIKDEIFKIMERIANPAPFNTITMIICCEGKANRLLSMVGYRNEHGIGTVLHIELTAETIAKLTASAWNAANNITDDKSND